MNLVTNAIDAIHDRDTNQSREEILHSARFIEIETTLNSDEQVVVYVRDSAGGMPPEIQAKLFDPFFTTKPVGKGTGLGLSISYKIVVEKHGGSIICNSTMGQGSEFIVSIPFQHMVLSTDELGVNSFIHAEAS